MTFRIYEKEPLLVAKGKELPVLQNDTEVTEIKATVRDGSAVIEVQLRQKSDEAFKKWLSTLKIDGKPEDRKKTHFWVTVEVKDGKLPITKRFLRQNGFQVISTNWHEPVDDPQIAVYTQYGEDNTYKNTFGTARGYTHAGLDIFSLEGSNVYACLDAEVFEIQKWTRNKGKSGYGHNITLKINNPQELANRKREYIHAYTTDLDSGSKFKENESPIFLFYAHLQDVFVKKGQKVYAGEKIGLSGISGVTKGEAFIMLKILN